MDRNKEGREDERYQQGSTPQNEGNKPGQQQDRNSPQGKQDNRGSGREEFIDPKGRRSEDEHRAGEEGMRQGQQQGTDRGEGRGTGRDTMGGTAQNTAQTGTGAGKANTPGMRPEDERNPNDDDRSGQPRK